MFNFSGSEIVFLLLLALIILGPEKLPEAIRKFGQTYAEFKKVTTGFQSELKQALDEPMREMRETADMFKQAATFDVTSPLEEAAASLKSITDPGPAAATPAPAERVDPAVSLAAADAADAAETAAAEAAAAAAADAAGAAPPLASAATATPEPTATEPNSAETLPADAPVVETPTSRRTPVAPKPPAAIDDEHRPFESKIISGGTKKPVTLDDVVARPDTEAPATDPGTPPA
ncbi:MAG: twin-arginine translocase TatA/TatE family subunit [Actinobacteria bacterium]|nr:twin-arginine translocase TatA/TatE family subunit [Actinomycetota bacterium]